MSIVDIDLSSRKPTPRVKLASRLYASGAVKTKQEAAEAAGLSGGYFSVITSPKNGSDVVKSFMDDVDEQIGKKTVSMSKVLEMLGRRAVRNIADLMEHANGEGTRLRAAQDLADRSGETQKIQRHQVEAFTISGQDAKELAAAMVESARVKDRYANMAEGDFVTVKMELEDAKATEVQEARQSETSDEAIGEQTRSVAPSATDDEQGLARSDEGHGPVGAEREIDDAKAQRLARIKEIKARKAQGGGQASTYEDYVEAELGQMSLGF